MILYFSGTGNSAYVAKRIGKTIQAETNNLFKKIRNRDFSEMHADDPWIVVAPTYAWRIPRILQEWLEKTKLSGCHQIYFVMTCAGGIGHAEKYLKKLCVPKNMQFMGCFPIIMPENYIAMFTTPTREKALTIIQQAEEKIDKAAYLIANGEMFPQLTITIKDRMDSGIVNNMFYPLFVHAKNFNAEDTCISCGKCMHMCPLKNIHIEDGRPIWGKNCTHCMACINRCPTQAIAYGKHSKGLPRYICPK